jgi:hypothetical protein
MFLYFNGDSQTLGTGVADHLFFENYPGHFHDLDKNKQLAGNWVRSREEYINKTGGDLRKKLDLENSQRAWPGQLGNILNAEVHNNAVGGSCIFSIYTRTVRDLEKFIRVNKIPDYVFIGLTTIERISMIYQDEYNLDRDNERSWVSTIMPFSVGIWDRKFQNYAYSHWDCHTDEDLLIFYLYQCLSIKNAVKSVIDREVIFVNTVNQWDTYTSIVKSTNSIMLKEIWAKLDFDSISPREYSLAHFGCEHGFVADGHFTEKGHREFAKFMASKYFKITG